MREEAGASDLGRLAAGSATGATLMNQKQTNPPGSPAPERNSPAWRAAVRRSRKRLLIILGFALVVGGAVSWWWSTGTNETREGQEALDAKKYDEAITHFSRAIRGNPRNAVAYAGRSWAYMARGEPQKALADSEAAIRLSPGLCDGYRARANVLANTDRLPEAMDALNEAIRRAPECGPAYYDRALLASKYGLKDTRSLADIQEAIRLDPKFAPAHMLEGYLLYERKEYDQAVAACDRALQIDRNYARAYFYRGMALLAKGALEQGRADVQRALGLDSSLQAVFEQERQKFGGP
jgi:tetratricopeptide (TPR) repeat protein